MSDHLIAEANRHAKALPVAAWDQQKEEDKTMSDTPRTDKRCLESQSLKSMSMRFAWMCDFARNLERENAALNHALNIAQTELRLNGCAKAADEVAKLHDAARKEAQQSVTK